MVQHLKTQLLINFDQCAHGLAKSAVPGALDWPCQPPNLGSGFINSNESCYFAHVYNTKCQSTVPDR
jgi:hypothetical protein